MNVIELNTFWDGIESSDETECDGIGDIQKPSTVKLWYSLLEDLKMVVAYLLITKGDYRK